LYALKQLDLCSFRLFTSRLEVILCNLFSLDLSAAFDTVDHAILLQRLQSEFGATDMPLSWLHSYLVGQTQFVKLEQQQSQVVGLDVGVPHGSVLGPLLFAVYSSPVADVIA